MASERQGLGVERLRAAFAAGGAPVNGGKDCPPPESLWAASRTGGGAAAAPEIVDHLAICGECAAAWRLGRELRDGTAKPRRGIPRTLLGGVLAAAAAMIAAGALIGALFATAGPGDLPPAAATEFRGDPASWLQPASGSDVLDLSRCVLRWAEGPPGTRYDVRVLDGKLRPLARGFHLGEPRFEVPTERLEGLEAGAVLLWQVTAQLPDGRRTQSSTFRSVLR